MSVDNFLSHPGAHTATTQIGKELFSGGKLYEA
jgi:hypothetical protein